MRAKDEVKFLADAYKKVILERVIDGKLMCPEACCGAPVMECKCGPDCPHCNCHEIQKLAKEEDNEERVRLTLDSPGTASMHLPKGDPRIQKYLDKGYKIVKDYKKAEQKSEDNEGAAGHLRSAASRGAVRAFATPELKRKDKQRQMWAKRKERWDAWKKKQARSEDAEDRDRRHHPHYGEPEYDEERSKRFREDDIPDISDEDRQRPIKSIEELDKEIQDEQKRRMKQLGWEDNEAPRDSMYLKDDPEALKKALIWHHGNYAKLRQKSIRGEQLTDDEWDSLKHSEGELDLHDQLQR